MQNILRYRNLFILFISVSLLIYAVIRAYTLSFTHDESLSFMTAEGGMAQLNSANNHKLNTLLMSFSKTLFGISEFSLRLPNVLSLLLYLFGCFLIFKRSKKNWLILFGFSIMTLHPFLIEFFSLARGYGLSLAFMLMSIYFLFESGKENPTTLKHLKHSVLALFFGVLALYANLSMVNYLISLQITLMIKYWVTRKKHFKSIRYDIRFFGIIASSLIPLFFEIKHLLKLQELNQLYFGASSVTQGIDSLLNRSISPIMNSEFIVLTIELIALMCLIMGIVLVIKDKKIKSPLFLILALISLLFTGLFLEHYIFGAKFPIERTALFYIPLFGVFIYYLFLHLTTLYNFKKKYFAIVPVFISTLLVINFLSEANITHTKIWRYDSHTKEVMKIIKEHTDGKQQKKSISSHWLFEPTINFYISIWGLTIHPANRKGIDENADFIYRLNTKTKLDHFKTLNVYGDIKSELLIRKEKQPSQSPIL